MSNKKPKELKHYFSGETILKGMPELAYVFNNKGQMLMWNKNVEQILGYTEDELYLRTLAEFIAPKDLEKTMLAMETIFRDYNEQTVEYSLITKSGKQLPYIGSGSYSLVDGEEFFIGMAISTFKLKETDNLLKEQIIKTNNLKTKSKLRMFILERSILLSMILITLLAKVIY